MSDTLKSRQQTDSKQGGEGTRAGNINPPGLYDPTISIGSRQAQINEATPPKDVGTK